MEILMCILGGALFAAGIYLLLQRQLLRIILGTALVSHGAHLLILTMGKLNRGAPPVLNEGIQHYTDPLPQALILTSIVISFGVTSFLLVLAYRAYQKNNTDMMDQLRGTEDE
ncbi:MULTISPECIES: Na(+)/H(+) antiporter subunit C [Fictibacillus]|uniref:Cation:proton antiporter n=1 Tax=Fictibacillus enclensis TaxID=1017270 RepID=A0A0V8JFI8_9BACL|nr:MULTISPECIES: Na(+)/H(+) antiporter subunit C [Fictibacillus]KSU85838.1 cation:proton antiporter [Fictibacillus enclensis]MDM5199797.1 Na(+)/H(+) antiporter subunit C [Fictibacillus enclensis]RXY98445.1 Na(+)/H(+) antiporter subunit C [Fictibacillus sp. S7]SCC03537.1 multicomponent Na+:H+ antiporter subunit C [Fictibacillus enclensis]